MPSLTVESVQIVRVLISCPNDALEAAQKVKTALEQEWRRVAGSLVGIRIDTVNWKEDSVGSWSLDGAQGAINETLLASAGAVIALFKWRLGTEWTQPTTGRCFPSGTVAEIQLGREADKVVRIYQYSIPPTDSDNCDQVQHARLNSTLEGLGSGPFFIRKWASDEELRRWVKQDVSLDVKQFLDIQRSNSAKTSASRPQVLAGSRPHVPSGFVARDEMAKLQAALETDGGATLFGGPGVGKSLLASRYAQECEQADWSFVGWVNAASRGQAVAEMAEIARLNWKRATDDPPEVATKRLVTWLNTTDQGSQPDRLLVFDNVEEIDDLKGLVPRGSGTEVVISTRRQSATVGTRVEVGVFTPDQAAKYLLDHTGLEDSDGATQVAEGLGRLPVALAQAAAVISHRRYSFADYRHALGQDPLDDVVRLEDGLDHYPVKVGRALRIAYTDATEACNQANPDQGQVARAVLQALSLLAVAGVPDRWLYAAASNETVTRDAVGELVSRSVICRSDNGRDVYVHRLMSQVIREDNQAADRVAESIRSAIRVVDRVKTDDALDYMSNRTIISELGTHLAAVQTQNHSKALLASPEFLTVTLRTAARAMCFEDPYTVISLSDYVSDHARVLGPDHPRTLIFRKKLADAYESAGDLGQAIPLYEQNLNDRVRVLGPDNPYVLESVHSLAYAYLLAGSLSKAIPLFEQNLQDTLRVEGPDHRNALQSRVGLADAYRVSGDPGRAIPLFMQTLEASLRVLGPDDRVTLRVRHGLAYAHLWAGSLSEAIPLFEQNLQDGLRVLGPDNPETLLIRDGLAVAYRKAGDLGRAIPLYEQTLDDSLRVLGPDHPNTLASRNNLAYAFHAAGTRDRAIPLFEQNLNDRLRVLGPDHPDILASRDNLARAYRLSDQP